MFVEAALPKNKELVTSDAARLLGSREATEELQAT